MKIAAATLVFCLLAISAPLGTVAKKGRKSKIDPTVEPTHDETHEPETAWPSTFEPSTVEPTDTETPVVDVPTGEPETDFPSTETDYPTDYPETDFPTNFPETDFPTNFPETDYPTDTEFPTEFPETPFPTSDGKEFFGFLLKLPGFLREISREMDNEQCNYVPMEIADALKEFYNLNNMTRPAFPGPTHPGHHHPGHHGPGKRGPGHHGPGKRGPGHHGPGPRHPGPRFPGSGRPNGSGSGSSGSGSGSNLPPVPGMPSGSGNGSGSSSGSGSWSGNGKKHRHGHGGRGSGSGSASGSGSGSSSGSGSGRALRRLMEAVGVVPEDNNTAVVNVTDSGNWTEYEGGNWTEYDGGNWTEYEGGNWTDDYWFEYENNNTWWDEYEFFGPDFDDNSLEGSVMNVVCSAERHCLDSFVSSAVEFFSNPKFSKLLEQQEAFPTEFTGLITNMIFDLENYADAMCGPAIFWGDDFDFYSSEGEDENEGSNDDEEEDHSNDSEDSITIKFPGMEEAIPIEEISVKQISLLIGSLNGKKLDRSLNRLFGQNSNWEHEQQDAIIDELLNTSAVPSDFSEWSEEDVMNTAGCLEGIDEDQITELGRDVVVISIKYFGVHIGWNDDQLTNLANQLKSDMRSRQLANSAYGSDVSVWTRTEVADAGTVAAGLTAHDVSVLPLDAILGLSPAAIARIAKNDALGRALLGRINEMNKGHAKQFSSEQTAAMTSAQKNAHNDALNSSDSGATNTSMIYVYVAIGAGFVAFAALAAFVVVRRRSTPRRQQSQDTDITFNGLTGFDEKEISPHNNIGRV